MSKVLVTDSHLTAIGNAIRSQLGTNTLYKPSQMAAAIENISSGGATPSTVGYPIHNDQRTHIYIDLPSSLLDITLSLKTTNLHAIYWDYDRQPSVSVPLDGSGSGGSIVSASYSYDTAGIKHIMIMGQFSGAEIVGGNVNGSTRSTLITHSNNIAMSDACLVCIKSIETPLLLSTASSGTTSRAFYGCSGLSQLVLSRTTGVGSYCCGGISGLTRVTLPSNLITIGDHAFYGTGITTITIPSAVTNIANQAFGSCTKLTEIHFQGTVPPVVAAANAFNSLPTFCKIYVPTGYLTDYTTATNYPNSSTYTYIEE